MNNDTVDVAVGGYVLTFERGDIDCDGLEVGRPNEVTVGAERDRTPQELYVVPEEAVDPD